MKKDLNKVRFGSTIACISDDRAFDWVRHDKAFDERDLALINRAINMSRGIIFSALRERENSKAVREAIARGEIDKNDLELVVPGCRDTREAFMPFFRLRIDGETFFYFLKLYKDDCDCGNSLHAEVVDATDQRLVCLLDN